MILLILLATSLCVLSKEVCPGGTFSCPDYATCCQLSDLSYGCCPIKNAVCCDDHIHCCPQFNKCDAGLCIQLDYLNITSHNLYNSYTVKCFGSEYICPDDTTCCKKSEPDTYACCPIEHAVCCEDGNHCCPQGMICDLEAEKCIGQGFVSKMYDFGKNKINVSPKAKYLRLVKSNNVTSIVCPGSSFQCPNGYTCCQLPSGDWGCCPYVNAICCKDHLHCCPSNMKCDSKSQACIQGLKSIPSIPYKIAEPVNLRLVCPDHTICSDSMSCCKMSQTQFGCCPYPNAACCSDHVHCCPSDYNCDVQQKKCVPKSNSSLQPIFPF